MANSRSDNPARYASYSSRPDMNMNLARAVEMKCFMLARSRSTLSFLLRELESPEKPLAVPSNVVNSSSSGSLLLISGSILSNSSNTMTNLSVYGLIMRSKCDNMSISSLSISRTSAIG